MNIRLTAFATTALGAIWGAQAFAQTELTMWYHGAGNPEESAVLDQIVEEFNASQSDWSVVVQSFPAGAYNDTVIAGALAGNLPDIIDVDGPVMPSWAWAGYIQPLEIDQGTIENFLPTAIGRWKDDIYSVGLWEAAVAMVTRRSVLEKYDIRIPTLAEPWTRDELDAALEAIKEGGEFDYPLDLGMAWSADEWYPYAFAPFLQSFGGDLIDRSTYLEADGVLNGDAGIEFGEWWQSLFDRELVPGTSQDPADRDSGLIDGKYAMSWNGNWAAANAVEAFGDDVLFLPAPDFGNGPKIGAASWQFAVSASSDHPEGANQFIEFMLQDRWQVAFSNAQAVIPATSSAAAESELYAEGAPMAVFYDLSKEQALLRPVTPGYPVMAKIFRKALADIASGADVADTLDAAADEIDADIEANNGYGN